MVYTSIVGTLPPVHEGNGVAGLLAAPALNDPANQDKPMYIDSVTGHSVSVKNYRRLIPRASAYLQQELGVQKGDVVGVFGINTIFTPATQLATIALGAVLSPANVMYSSKELAHQLHMTKPKVFVVFDPLVPVVEGAQKIAKTNSKILTFSAWHAILQKLVDAESAPEVQPVPLDGKKTHAYYCFSSGTSGLPKGVITTHYNIFSNAVQGDVFEDNLVEPWHKLGLVLPMSHIFGLNVGTWLTLYKAHTTLVFPKFDLEDFVSKCVKYEINWIILVPPIILALGKTPIIDKYPKFAECVKVITNGAAPLSQETVDLVHKKAPKIDIGQGYGLTETSPIVHMGVRKDPHFDSASIGWLVPGAEAMLVDPETGKEVTKFNERGELWTRGPMVMAGYLHNEAATKECMTEDGWFKTGDVAIVNEHQQFYIVDRIKELIKSNGHQVAPAELEALLTSNDQVLDAAVIGVYNDNKTTEMPRAYLQLAPNADVKSVIDWFNKRVAKHKRLWGGVVVIDAVPKSPTGKILRKDLRTRAEKDKPIYGSEVASL